MISYIIIHRFTGFYGNEMKVIITSHFLDIRSSWEQKQICYW